MSGRLLLHNTFNVIAAAACYAERYTQCQDLLKGIGDRLELHRNHQEQTPISWTHARDLGKVIEALAHIPALLDDQSVVDAKRLER